MKKYGIRIFYETSHYREVEAEDIEDAIMQAYEAVEETEHSKWCNELIDNLYDCNDPEVTEL